MNAIERLKPYSGKLVAVQLREPMFVLEYGGTAMIDGVEQHGVKPAFVTGKSGPEPIGFAQLLPAVLIEVSDTAVLLKMIDPATRALLCIDVPAEEVLYITSIARPPSMIVPPAGS